MNLVKYGDKSRPNCFVNQSGKTAYKRLKFEREPGLTGLEPLRNVVKYFISILVKEILFQEALQPIMIIFPSCFVV